MKHLLIRAFVAGLAAIWLAGPSGAGDLGDDGLYKADWLRDTFKDLPEDVAEAKSEGRRVVLLIEQRGCIYCKKMHEEVFPDPRIKTLLETRYFPIQINLHGDTEVVDTDGEALTEKQAMRKWNVMFTPTMVFLPPDLEEGKSAIQQAVAVMPGAFGPGTTLDMLTWVLEQRYLNEDVEDFQRYHARMIRERNDGDAG